MVAWGANHNWAEVQEGRRRREGENPVPHYWDHVQWVWGASPMEDFIERTKDVHLDGVVEKITVPFLITHGVATGRSPWTTPTRATARPSTAPSASCASLNADFQACGRCHGSSTRSSSRGGPRRARKGGGFDGTTQQQGVVEIDALAYVPEGD